MTRMMGKKKMIILLLGAEGSDCQMPHAARRLGLHDFLVLSANTKSISSQGSNGSNPHLVEVCGQFTFFSWHASRNACALPFTE